jgi:hypothetical protein
MRESRSTFRDKCPDVCWQRQLRDRYTSEGVPPVPHLDLKRAVVRPVSRKLAEQIILRYEWLGAMGATSRHYGIFFGPYCAGVTCVCASPGGANLNAHMEWGLERAELAYLARGANVHWSPVGANSKLVAWTCRLLALDGMKLIIAYSDPDAGEIGTIYQACGWAYVGKGASTCQWVAPNGRIYDQKLPYDLKRRDGATRAYWCQWLRQQGYHEQQSMPKHRYVCILDKTDAALIARVEAKRQPYPKRASVVESTTSADQAGSGGSRPTRTLQPKD